MRPPIGELESDTNTGAEPLTDFFTNLAHVLAQLAPFLLVGFTIAGLLHVFIPVNVLGRHLGAKGVASTVKAALFGVPLPLCSCGVIPVAVELRKQGASRGATASFLVATPETGVDSIAASVAVMHPLLVVFRPIAALVTAITAGTLVERLTEPAKAPAEEPACCDQTAAAAPPPANRLVAALRYGFVDLFGEIIWYLLPAAAVTALVTTFIEPQAFAGIVESRWLQMAMLLVAGIPIYVCATAATPVAAALIVAGFSPGAALVFLLVGPATNVVTITAAARTLGKAGAVVYCLSVIVVSVVFGVLLDVLFDRFELSPSTAAAHLHDQLAAVHWVGLGILLAVFGWHAWMRLRKMARR